ncbi:MAG: DNA primase [Lachnospiraceae bacterium]|nr:DNA primase [Lachnospiraceae bacterium]
MRYDESVIEQVRSANDIVDIVGRYVRLTKKGANYFGLCPFHGEKTASFSVSPRKQIYYCFGCHAGGNVISFLMEYENYSFTEALKALAENAHIELPESAEEEDKGAKELRSRLLEINKEAAIYYNRVLRSPAGRPGYEYLAGKRALSNQTITHFGLGFSEKKQDALYRYLKEKGYDDEILDKSGLITYKETGIRDKFWNRVIFPIMDTNNRVIGFGGRVMGDGEPKYLNSPETLIFDKSSTLYGLNFARKSRSRYLLLCEGYMDVIALHQAGFTNAVASLGTAFTENHARLLKRYTEQVILTQDSDQAGISAKLRAFPILHDAGISVKVLEMEGYKDPDEFIRANGPEAYEQCIRSARNAFLYMIDVLKESFDQADPAERTAFMRETADRLCMFRDKLERDNYIDAVSTEFMIDRDELSRLVDRMIENGSHSSVFRDIDLSRRTARLEAGRKAAAISAAEGSGDSEEEKAAAAKYEKILASWIAERPELAPAVFRYISPDSFKTRIYRIIAETAQEQGSAFDAAAFLDRNDLTESDRKLAAEAFAESDQGGGAAGMEKADLEKGLAETVSALLSIRLDAEIRRCGNDLSEFGRLQKEKNKLRNLRIPL